jgi:hypothetical protein
VDFARLLPLSKSRQYIASQIFLEGGPYMQHLGYVDVCFTTSILIKRRSEIDFYESGAAALHWQLRWPHDQNPQTHRLHQFAKRKLVSQIKALSMLNSTRENLSEGLDYSISFYRLCDVSAQECLLSPAALWKPETCVEGVAKQVPSVLIIIKFSFR